LIINNHDDGSNYSHLLFKRNGTNVGRLHIDNQNYTLGTSVTGGGQGNTVFGFGAFTSDNTGDYNVAIGQDLMRNNTSGSYNIAIGKQALYKNTAGEENVAIGYMALKENNGSPAGAFDNSSYITAVGSRALQNNTTGYNNTAVGSEALNANKEGYTNTAIGYEALMSNTTGHDNTAIGVNACSQVTGSNNTCIGANSGPGSGYRDGTGSDYNHTDLRGSNNRIYIGDANSVVHIRGRVVIDGENADGSTDRGLYVRNGMTVNGNATLNNGLEVNNSRATMNNGLTVNNGYDASGVGTTLHVSGRAQIDEMLYVRDDFGIFGGGLAFSGADRNHADNVGIGKANAWQAGRLGYGSYGAFFFLDMGDGNDQAQVNSSVNSNINAMIARFSDRRLKYVGSENKSGLEKIKQLKVFNYTFKKDSKKTPRVGVMAQDLQKVFPDAVTKGKDGFLMIRMEDMFYAVVNAVKELDAKITVILSETKNLKTQLTEILKQVQDDRKILKQVQNDNKQLKKENAELKARLDRLEAKMK